MKVLTLNKKNLLSLLLLLGIIFSVIQIGRSASPDPGHPWADIGDTANDFLILPRGGTSTTSPSADCVIIGNNYDLPPGNSGNVLTSNGAVWTSSALSGLVLLYTDETNSTEVNTSNTDTMLKNWNINVVPSSYRYFILESEVMANQGLNANTLVSFNWNFMEGANLKKTIAWRTYGISYANVNMGIKYATTIKTIVPATSTPPNANFMINGQMNNKNAGATMMALSFRVYGVK